MYAMICTRLDISQVDSVVNRYMINPGTTHWQVVKWILRYLRDIADVGWYLIGVVTLVVLSLGLWI